MNLHMFISEFGEIQACSSKTNYDTQKFMDNLQKIIQKLVDELLDLIYEPNKP